MISQTSPLNYRELGASIQSVYVDASKYQFDKHVPAFSVDDKYQGDFFSITIFEPRDGEAPIFYHTFSPYDIVSSKSPGHAAVFQSGKLLLNADVSFYVKQRTGVMSSLVLQALGHQTLLGKQVLIVGTGSIARCALASLKEYYSTLNHVDFINGGSEAGEFLALADQLGINTERGDLNQVGTYDVILCHSSAKQPVLTADLLGKVKSGAFIATFGSEDHAEVAEEYYDTSNACVLIDRDETVEEATELKSAVDKGIAKRESLNTLSGLFSGIDLDVVDKKKYTIYRSHGTPMQDLAYLKLLLGTHD